MVRVVHRPPCVLSFHVMSFHFMSCHVMCTEGSTLHSCLPACLPPPHLHGRVDAVGAAKALPGAEAVLRQLPAAQHNGGSTHPAQA